MASPQCQKEYRVLDIRLPFDLRRQQYFFFLIFSHQTFFPRGGEVPVHPHLNNDNWCLKCKSRQSFASGSHINGVQNSVSVRPSHFFGSKMEKGRDLPREGKLVVPPRSVPPFLICGILVPGALCEVYTRAGADMCLLRKIVPLSDLNNWVASV